MTDTDSQLALAAQRVAAGRLIVARQRALIARLQAAGHPTIEHERTLTIFINTLTIFEDHERELRRAVREQGLGKRQPPVLDEDPRPSQS